MLMLHSYYPSINPKQAIVLSLSKYHGTELWCCAYTAHPLAGDCNAVEMFRTGPPAADGAGGKLFQEHRCDKL